MFNCFPSISGWGVCWPEKMGHGEWSGTMGLI